MSEVVSVSKAVTERSEMTTLRKRWLLLGAGSLLAYVGVYALVEAFFQAPSRAAVLDIMNVFPPLVVALICGFASAKATGRPMRLFWGFIALAHLFTAFAESVWAWYDLVLLTEIPYPSWADLYWILFYPLVLGGLLMLVFVPGNKRLLGIAVALDALLFAGAAGGLGWELMIRPVVDPAAGFVENVTNIAYPAGDLLLLAGLASIAVGVTRGRSPRGMRWLAVAFAVTFLADMAYAQMVAAGNYEANGWIDTFWPLGYMLVGVGALVYVSTNRRELVVESDTQAIAAAELKTSPSEALRRFMPYIAVVCVAFLAYYHFIAKGGGSKGEDAIIIGICIFLPTLVLLRQLVVIVENRRLQASLSRLSAELETLVSERTEELAAEKEHLVLLNTVAVEMSHCMTAAEVVNAGVRLVAQAGHCDAVAVSANAPRGRPYFVASEPLSKAGRSQFRTLLRNSPQLKRLQEGRSRAEEPIRLEGPDLGAEDAPRSAEWPFQAVTALPLVSRRASLGILLLAQDRADSPLSDEELALSQGIASQLAVALESAHRYEDARYLSESDPVTNLLNHRGIGKRLDQEIARSERAGSCFALVMMDLDNFKLFNDTYGHVTGDQVLLSTASTLGKAVRGADVLGRYGGDEFVALLPDTDAAGAASVVERIRSYLSAHPFRVEDGSQVPLCMSYGVALYPFQGRQPNELLAMADANLYRSKQRGGDCVTTPDTEDHRRDVSGGVFTVLDGLVNTVDNKDHYTRKHSDDVTERALALATGLGLSPETQRSLRIAGLLHDVGKIGIPDSVLRKPGPLTAEEYEAIKQHVDLGELIIKDIPNLHEVLAAVGSHHERYDGEGYPRGLKGEEIPLLGRILAVTDAYSAMTTDRPYRKALTLERAKAELRSVAGAQLDPNIVEAFLSILEQDDGTCEATEAASALSVA